MADQHTILFSMTLLPCPDDVGDLVRGGQHHEVLALNPKPEGTTDVVQPLKIVPEKMRGTLDEIMAALRGRLEQYLRVQDGCEGHLPVAIFGGGDRMVSITHKARDLRPRT